MITSQEISESGLMNLEQAAVYLGISVVTARRLRRMKKLPFITLAGKLMIRKQWIDDYLERLKGDK